MNIMEWKRVLHALPYIAILRGLIPENAIQIIGALQDAGFRAVEIPFNGPEPLKSLESAVEKFGDDLLLGGGTVLTSEDVTSVYNAGGRFVVSPNSNHNVIKTTKSFGMVSIPGVSTPSEAFAAVNVGADALKLFPAENLPPVVVKAWRAVLPKDLWLLPVGGVTPASVGPYLAAGANGFGLGSSLFQSDWSTKEVVRAAQTFVCTYRSLVG